MQGTSRYDTIIFVYTLLFGTVSKVTEWMENLIISNKENILSMVYADAIIHRKAV